ncbi:hypothetical protein QBC41DRAFT_229430 [Cercophora samala]|uniref:Uncharacterized protein n=1 Tax=Cercophora samala TaxID=330535 RepID=A0AA39Z9X8_9PEZI|nr:hypothetical protein QBC41DRAFT_229430 [Cercophora samala]
MPPYLCQCRAPGQGQNCKAKESCMVGHFYINRCQFCRIANCGPVKLEDKYTIASLPSSSFVPTPGTKEENSPADILPPHMNIHRAWGKAEDFVPGVRPLHPARGRCQFPQFNGHDEKQ